MPQTFRRITADTIEVTTTYTQKRTMNSCPQCGMYCQLTDTPAKNHAMRAGDKLCYGCQWANVSLHPGRLQGMTWETFTGRKERTNAYTRHADQPTAQEVTQ